MQARTRKFSKMSVAKVSKIRNAEYKISTIYDYDKDKTDIEIESKIDKLPRIYQLNFLRDTLELINKLYEDKLEQFESSEKTVFETKVIQEMESILEKREQELKEKEKEKENAIKEGNKQKNVQEKREYRVKSRKTYQAGGRYSL
jgi:hypothetical protein